MEFLKFASLFLGIMFTITNIGRVYCRQKVSAGNVVLQTLGITLFLFLQFRM